MKILLISFALLLSNNLWAQNAAAAKKPASKLAPSAQKAVEEVTPIDDDPSIKLDEMDLAIAKIVHTGEVKCELGTSVTVTPSKREGFFVRSEERRVGKECW